MRQTRSVSQILFGYLPHQTVDLAGRVWKVKEWQSPARTNVDQSALRKELLRLVTPWELAGTDAEYAKHLRQQREVVVYALDRDNGVKVESFPPVWLCRSCRRLHSTPSKKCKCGSDQFGQLPFVGFHECGALRAPFISPCRTHKEVRMRQTTSASAADIVFDCPICNTQLQKGFGSLPCGCGAGRVVFMPHRTAQVFTPRTVVLVNPPDSQSVRKVTEAGGSLRALHWMLESLEGGSISDLPQTASSLRDSLVKSGFKPETVEAMLGAALKSGELAPDPSPIAISDEQREAAEGDAVKVALALGQSRIRLRDFAEAASSQGWTARSNAYRHAYPVAFARAGIQDVELVDKFPVITGNFGFTRGDATPGKSRLNPFRVGVNYAVLADKSVTEALFVRLLPSRVAKWLAVRSWTLDAWTTEREARLSILKACIIPVPGAPATLPPSAGTDLLRLVHSFAHRLIRRTAVFAGIERTGLSELLVPSHMGFFLYAAGKGDFVLGGLQAVFETELDRLINDFVLADHRCALDPGCRDEGAACHACLHLGEPSCRYFNCFLDRDVLSGPSGYLRLT